MGIKPFLMEEKSKFLWNSNRDLKMRKRKKERSFEIIGDGTGIHWPELDEDLSV